THGNLQGVRVMVRAPGNSGEIGSKSGKSAINPISPHLPESLGSKWVGWCRRPGQRWERVCEGTDQQVWDRLLSLPKDDGPVDLTITRGQPPWERREPM